MMKLKNLLPAILLGVSVGCSSSPKTNDPGFASSKPTNDLAVGFEKPGYIDLEGMLPDAIIRGEDHIVSDKIYNDGYANTYEIHTEDLVYVVQGREKAIQRIYEIEAIKISRRASMPEVVGGTVAGKVKSLAVAPVDFAKSGIKRVGKVDSAKDAVFLVPGGIGSLVRGVGEGVYEIGKTGVGATKQGVRKLRDKDSDCTDIACDEESGNAAQKGVYELSGAGSRARQRHKDLGTDPYSDNVVLQKEINRVAYSAAASNLTLSVGLGVAGLPPTVAAYRSGVGYYNNTKSLIDYSNPFERETVERKTLTDWGVKGKTINRFYRNTVYTPTTRSQLIAILQTIPSVETRAELLKKSVKVTTDYAVRAKLNEMSYLAELTANDPNGNIDASLPLMATRSPDNQTFLILSADYLIWSTDFSETLRMTQKKLSARENRDVAVHIIGAASPRVRQELTAMDVELKVIARR